MNMPRTALLAAVLALSPGAAFPQARSFPDTRDRVHAFSDQLQSGMTGAQYSFAASHYDGCQKMLLDDVRALRAFNPSFIVLHYQLGCGNGAAAFIDGNEWVSDWAAVNAHEDWFMHQGGTRLHQGAWDWYLTDIANAGYRSYWADACIQRMRDTECDGAFADSFTVDGYFGALSPDHPWFTDTSACLANWIPLLGSYADYIAGRFAATPERFYFIPNIGGLVTGWDTTDYAGLGDGGMVEGFGAGGTETYLPLDDWRLQMDRVLQLARQSRVILCQSYTSDSAPRERLFLLGCHLLVKGDRTYFNMIGAEHDEELLWYPEYDVPIGAYSGSVPASIDALHDPASGCYRRDFANGIVLVNPGDSDLSVPDLGGTYQLVSAQGGGAVDENGVHGGGLSYSPVSSVIVEAHGAAVLLRQIPASLHTVAFALDKTEFGTAESLTLHWSIRRGAASPSPADAWVAVMTPWGTLYFYRAGSFSPSVGAVVESLAVSDLSGDLGPFALAGLRAGGYTWYGVLTTPGADPRDSSSWISTLGAAPFSID